MGPTAPVAAPDRRQVEVHEQTPALAGVGAELQLAPNATSALPGLGPLERVCAIACRPESWNSFDAADGTLTLQLPLGEQVEETWTEESWAAEGKVGDLLDALSAFAEPAWRMAGAASFAHALGAPRPGGPRQLGRGPRRSARPLTSAVQGGLPGQ